MVVVVVDLIVAQITLKMNLVLVNIDSDITYQEIEDILQIGSGATQSILHDYLGLEKVTCRWVSHFLTEAQKQDRVDYCLKMLEKFDDGRSKRVYDTGFTIMIQKRSVKVKFGLQAMILVQSKFVDNVLLANTCLQHTRRHKQWNI